MYKAQILQIYHHPFSDNALTIYENIRAFKKYSNFDVLNINAHNGFPRNLYNINFQFMLLHYSLFLKLSEQFYAYLKQQNNSTIVAFYQYEHINCQKRFKMIDSLNIKIVFSMLNNEYHYICKNNTSAEKVYHNFTGYVDDSSIKSANALRKLFNKWTVDIGYRARPLPYFMGRGAQEKTQIGANMRDFGLKWHASDSAARKTDEVYSSVIKFGKVQ